MRRELGAEVFLWLAAALFLALGFGWHEGGARPYELKPREPGDLRLVTWNVGAGAGSWGRPMADEHLEHVAAVIGALEPDLVLLQELDHGAQLLRLRNALGPDWYLASQHLAGRSLGVLARGGELERFSVEGSGGSALGVAYRPAPSRGLLPLAVVVVHADASSSEKRNGQIGTATRALFARDEPGRILAGDLNLDVDLGKRRDLFTDDEYRDVETYNWLAGRLTDAGLFGGSTAEPDRRLDYVFVEGKRLEVLGAGPWKGRRAGRMDHDPVVADLRPR